jgi:UDP-N-acetylglucosamine 2-epimerase (non-hydrolysing)
MVFTHGDTTTSMAVSLCAHMALVPVFHVEAGLRTYSREPFPEQLNTRVSDAASDVYLAPVERNAQNLVSEGLPRERIFVVGNTVIDIAKWAASKCTNVVRKYKLVKPLIYFSIHRRETTMDKARFSGPVEAMLEAEEYNFFVSMRPGTRAALERYGLLRDLEKADHVTIHDSIPSYIETIGILRHCDAILSDSGSMPEEASALHIPFMTARYVCDRPETIASGSNILVGLSKASVLDGMRKVMEDADFRAGMVKAPSPYGDGDASRKIADIAERLSAQGDLLRFEKEVTRKNV